MLPIKRLLLSRLTLDARLKLTHLAAELDVSPQLLRYHLEALRNEGLVDGFFPIINIYRLGYFYFRLLCRFRTPTPRQEADILRHLHEHRHVGWICQYQGDFDLAAALWTTSLEEFNQVLQALLVRFSPFLEQRQISITTRVLHFPHTYLALEPGEDAANPYAAYAVRGDRPAIEIGGAISNSPLDELDLDILGELTRDGRASSRAIAHSLDGDPRVVSYRMLQLQRHKIIVGWGAKLNHQLLGFTHQKIFLNLVLSKATLISSIINYLRGVPNVICVTCSIGAADLEFEAMVRTPAEFQNILRNLRFQFPEAIRSYTSMVVMREPLINYMPVRKQADRES